jgi:iron complex transport system substrate-binding protein
MVRGVRIASLLPSATEMVCALGAGAELVGRSHECDFPPGVERLPVLTSARVGPLPSSRAIDRAVREILRDALSIYQIDLERLRQAAPEVIVTQDLCEVCAVSLDDVRSAVARLARQDVTIVNLRPTRLEDIWTEIGRVAEAIGRVPAGERVVADLRGRVAEIARRATGLRSRPRVLTFEWIDPVLIGGLWMPELVALAGGEPLVTRVGDHAPTLERDQLASLDPDVVLVKPCGFSLDRTLAELGALREALPPAWHARIYLADGNAYFNRPGPRIVESLEILAACVHPEAFEDFTRKHAESVRSWESVNP